MEVGVDVTDAAFPVAFVEVLSNSVAVMVTASIGSDGMVMLALSVWVVDLSCWDISQEA